MLKPKLIRTLNLKSPPAPGRPPHLSSASGLVSLGDSLYLIADDECHLARFLPKKGSPIDLISLLDRELPLGAKARKKAKPDFEALVEVPGGLLVIPSGSKRNRTQGVFYPFKGTSVSVDWSALFEEVQEAMKEAGGRGDDLNIEGAARSGEQLLLFQRGNGKSRFNAVIELHLPTVLRSIRERAGVRRKAFRRLIPYDLGGIQGFPLGFTDAVGGGPENRVVFLGVAEGKVSSVDDGEFLGAIFGELDLKTHRVLNTRYLDIPWKPEGLCRAGSVASGEFYLVTDADDPAIPSALFKVKV